MINKTFHAVCFGIIIFDLGFDILLESTLGRCEWLLSSDAGRWKSFGVSVVKVGQNQPLLVGIGLTYLPNIGGPVPPPPDPFGSGIPAEWVSGIMGIRAGYKNGARWPW